MIWGKNRRHRIVSQRVTCLLVYSYTTASTYIGLLEPTLRETTAGSEQYIVFLMQSGSVTKLSRTHKGWNQRIVVDSSYIAIIYILLFWCMLDAQKKYQAPYLMSVLQRDLNVLSAIAPGSLICKTEILDLWHFSYFWSDILMQMNQNWLYLHIFTCQLQFLLYQVRKAALYFEMSASTNQQLPPCHQSRQQHSKPLSESTGT